MLPRLKWTKLLAVSSSALLGRNLPRVADMYERTYTTGVVGWDPDKADANLEKHGIDFADAATVLSDELALTRPDDDPDEERFLTLGIDALGRLLVVVYTWRDDEVRLISARRATPSERKQYESHR